MNTPIELCRSRNSARSRVVPSFVIDKQVKQFECPLESEGWDEIEVVDDYDHDKFQSLYDSFMDCRHVYETMVHRFGSQHNSHHNLSLEDHCNLCEGLAEDNSHKDSLACACRIHDYGKVMTKTFWEKDDYKEAHYPNHANVSAVMALNMGFGIEVARLVGYHMIPYMDPKAQQTWRDRMDDDLWNEIHVLHIYDKMAH